MSANQPVRTSLANTLLYDGFGGFSPFLLVFLVLVVVMVMMVWCLLLALHAVLLCGVHDL